MELSNHKGDEVRQAIRAAEARLVFLPPYSPDLNPIEQVFAKLKELLRKKDARSVEQTWRSIGDVLTNSPQTSACDTSPMLDIRQLEPILL